MKTIKKIILVIVAIATLTAVSGISSIATAQHAKASSFRLINNSDVIAYLTDHGYSLITILEVQANGTRKCSTSLQGYYTYVYLNTAQTAIVSTQDIQI